ncbi:unnamed protein product [Vicia faba]|uniref:Uncharacterized protein n=1 Tax=Vicia faba TaxID=3906 RepID=A0AAV0ZMW8_VICFA|nr:unnamed protein product [Vicia faba]
MVVGYDSEGWFCTDLTSIFVSTIIHNKEKKEVRSKNNSLQRLPPANSDRSRPPMLHPDPLKKGEKKNIIRHKLSLPNNTVIYSLRLCSSLPFTWISPQVSHDSTTTAPDPDPPTVLPAAPSVKASSSEPPTNNNHELRRATPKPQSARRL